ncbi:Domain of uncharacterised function (DUF2825) [Escherichia coli]|nr:Domain of uncharacterised function (DUF2825) [Escherichia coli]
MVVYPRWRGELDRTASVVSSGSGLSPLARGTPVFANLWTIAIRFIPAGAGNTGARNTKPCICSVYPRWRGEHWLCNSSTHDHVGLSPLARGTRLNMYIYSLPYQVYPRWRGEHRLCLRLYRWWRGLSPLARGTPERGAARHAKMRFIPAGAGNTVDGEFFIAGAPVYPRWRGEHDRPRHLAVADQGLSPLARGTQRLFPAQTLRIRFIPAGAGNTAAKS